ncbi:HAMP domain-containing histidine kinase [Paenibacillus zeisoli]|uniref:histidine kinase n=1 Tax=Paenibacillus zeisoli TaxID=2496267 RepID=A0A433XCD2_9BACL|nr:HAMP domain-containing sensor histidine kinase [Paenibacillus zeisoli]RUT31732.1 HAMP domain-containing histidine kinase [Paenibacillus zeisoli]
MIRRRLTLRFAVQLAVAGSLLVILAILIVIWMLARFKEIEFNRSFAPLGISKLIEDSRIDSKGLIADPVLLKRLREDGGWLQSLDAKGNVIQSFNAPDDLPARYVPGQLIDYWIGGEPFPYKLGLWIQEKEGHLYTLLYGSRAPTEDLLVRLIDDGRLRNHSLTFSPSTLSLLAKRKASVQVLSREGEEIAAWSKRADAPESYTLQELAVRSTNQAIYGTVMDSRYDKRTGLTWLIQYPMENGEQGALPVLNVQPEVQVMIIGIAAFLCSSLLVFFFLSAWYARRFGTPILHILGSIERLGSGDYTDPSPIIEYEGGRRRKWIGKRQGKRQDRHQDKRLQSSGNRIFGEVIESVGNLALALRTGQDAAEQTQLHREEWIAGVTHDLKTPLSSVQGYAHMLAAEKYSWSEEEMRKFAAIILEKTNYMDKLINDLGLTYRLRNGDIPVVFEQRDIGALLMDSVSRAAEHPAYDHRRVRCTVPAEPIVMDIHPPWLERIIENIVANSLNHNPLDTTIHIELSGGSRKEGVRIDITDNGQGMDGQTVGRLFERYFRGLSTESETEGSGLGMAVTKELVQAMGGRIEVHSRLGEGTVVSLIWDK